MPVSQIDRSNYYRGLLILVGKDRIIDPRERELMIQLGRILDFDLRFCEAAIDDVIGNKYLTDDPVLFEHRETAECFLRDAIRVALVDEAMHPKEMTWIRSIADANNVKIRWLEAEVLRVESKKRSNGFTESFEIERFLSA